MRLTLLGGTNNEEVANSNACGALGEFYGACFRDAGASTCGAVDANVTRAPTRQSPATAAAPSSAQEGGSPAKATAPRQLTCVGDIATRAEYIRGFCDGSFNSR